MKVAAIGECMVELSSSGEGAYALGFGGDTLNTATYLARLGVATGYVTVLGDDPYSDAMLARWLEEGVDCALVKRLTGRMPGLYMIERDARGERRFFYWRERSPARELMSVMDAPGEQALAECDWVYFSGITLSLYEKAERARFVSLLERLRARGVRLAFDGNYRPRGWASREEARGAFEEVLPLVHLALPTFEDEQAVFGDADAQEARRRLLAYGIEEVAIKQGERGALVATRESTAWVIPELTLQPVDTTAAGDSFNAGYLAARLRGAAPAAAAREGHGLAGAVIMHRGAIIPKEAMPPLKGKENQ